MNHRIPGQVFARCPRLAVEADRLPAAVLHDDVGMIAQVGADARQVVRDRHADGASAAARATTAARV